MDREPPEDEADEPQAEEPGQPSDADGSSADQNGSDEPDDTTESEAESTEAADDAAEEADDEDKGEPTEDATDSRADDAPPDEGLDAVEWPEPGEETDEEAETDEDDAAAAAPTTIDDDYEVPTYGQADGPSEDQEMPLAEHIEEMLKRLAVIVAVAGIVSLVTFPIAEEVINFLWNSILPEGEITRPRLYGILELKLTELKVASLAGLIVALPVLVHQTYQFMRPGLYPHERRYYLAAIPTSLVLALVGVSFAYFIVLPAIFTYFLYYSQDVATIGFALGRTFDLILILMGYLAIVFQIPLFIMLAMMMGLVTRQWLADRRILFWGGFLGLSFIFSPDPTGMAPIVVALTMVVLFEGTLLLTKWTRGRS